MEEIGRRGNEQKGRRDGNREGRQGSREKGESYTLSDLAGFLEPVSEVTNKVEEKVPIWYTDHFITDLDKQGKSLGSLETKTLSNTATKVL